MATAVRYAGFWRRLAAVFIDSALYSAVTMSLLLLFHTTGLLSQLAVSSSLEQVGTLWALVFEAVVPLLLTVILWRLFGGTPGKLLMECRVVDVRTGTNPRLLQCLLRCLAYFISALPLCLGFLWIGWDRRKQGWHDKIARTVVIIEDEPRLTVQALEQGLR